MAQLDNVIERFVNGEPLSFAERTDLIRLLRQTSIDSAFLNSIVQADGSLRVGTIFADTIIPTNPITRIVNRYISSSTLTIPTGEETSMTFNASVFGAGDNPLAQACVIPYGTTMRRYQRHPSLPELTALHLWGIIDMDAGGNAGSEMYINWYSKDTNAFLGAYTYQFISNTGQWHHAAYDIVAKILDDEYIDIGVWNDSGAVREILTLELNCALA